MNTEDLHTLFMVVHIEFFELKLETFFSIEICLLEFATLLLDISKFIVVLAGILIFGFFDFFLIVLFGIFVFVVEEVDVTLVLNFVEEVGAEFIVQQDILLVGSHLYFSLLQQVENNSILQVNHGVPLMSFFYLFHSVNIQCIE